MLQDQYRSVSVIGEGKIINKKNGFSGTHFHGQCPVSGSSVYVINAELKNSPGKI